MSNLENNCPNVKKHKEAYSLRKTFKSVCEELSGLYRGRLSTCKFAKDLTPLLLSFNDSAHKEYLVQKTLLNGFFQSNKITLHHF